MLSNAEQCCAVPAVPAVPAGPLQADIGKRVEEKITKDQRRYFLMEQARRGALCFLYVG